MGGIFEPFLNNTIDKKLATEKTEISPKELLTKLTVKDLLPDDDLLQLTLKHKQTTLPIKTQKEVVNVLLDNIRNNKNESERLLTLVNNKVDELTAFGNILLRSSKHGAPLALQLYKFAMEKGDDRGAFSYANMIYRGYQGTPKNEEEGIKIMSELAKRGHPYAQMNLAAILIRTQPNLINSAIQLYELAGKSGLDKAYTELGRMYRLGYGVHQDHKKAIDYFKKGAQAGNPQCNFMLGVYYSSGLADEDNRQPDQAKAFKYFQKAAVKGMAEAQYNVGLRFLKGHGVEVNYFNAAEFFRMAAMQGFQLAQINLAGMYTEGRGVKVDLNEARHWLEKSATAGGSIGKDAQKRLNDLDEIQGKKKDTKCNIM
ncbi:uncharacterized protein BX663DRAFT_528545 [Cokeromyces recurvatus]|uniref:uncharacterized protein n=1 Tax=Cokeromyces recurvatus TaxID=90255 RepID=UPI00221EE016|nr:uncharacterized protein BX663DRAFT_528545 [Cokeromyces recurvatus]KAI7907933.1 hypothetical protein BX663DRAFT_528545 [Cokeromyces recurvatus]